MWVAGCGSKTGLIVPCRIPLAPVPAEVVLVVDDSGSVQITGGDGGNGQDWEDILASSSDALVPFENSLNFGALFFPAGGGNVCAVPDRIGVEPRPRNANAVQAYLATAPHEGLTPTAGALAVVTDFFRTHPSDRPRFVVLATDGASNCNDAITCDACRCPFQQNCCLGEGHGGNCLDNESVLQRVRDLRSIGVRTGVILLALDPRYELRFLAPALNEIAVAGGIAHQTGNQYFEGATREQLAASLAALFASMRTCRYEVPSEVPLNEGTVISIRSSSSTTVARHDAAHSQGWDLVPGSARAIELFGDACAQSRDQSSVVSSLAPNSRCELSP